VCLTARDCKAVLYGPGKGSYSEGYKPKGIFGNESVGREMIGEPGRPWSNWKGSWADSSNGLRVCSGYRLRHGIPAI
jgi:hypothetical protein